jgi:hypothetical protein
MLCVQRRYEADEWRGDGDGDALVHEEVAWVDADEEIDGDKITSCRLNQPLNHVMTSHSKIRAFQ